MGFNVGTAIAGGLIGGPAGFVGGGLAGGQDGSSNRSGGPQIGATNPGFADLADIFGFGPGSVVAPGLRVPRRKGTSAFEGLSGVVRDYAFNPLPVSDLERLTEQLANLTVDNLPETMAGLDALIPTMQELARTGGPVDFAPFRRQEALQFQNELLPQIKEEFGEFARSPGASEEVGRQRTGRLAGLDTLEAEFGERAQQRKLAAGPTAANLLALRAGLPLGLAEDIGSVGFNLRSQEEERRSRPITTFADLMGLGAGGNFIQGGYRPVDKTASIIGAYSQGIPSILSNSGLFGGG